MIQNGPNKKQSESKTHKVGFMSKVVEGVFEQFLTFLTIKLKLQKHFSGLKAIPETRGYVCLCTKD